MSTKVARDIALIVDEKREWLSESARVCGAGTARDGSRDVRRCALPEPHRDRRGGTLHGVPPSSISVEVGAVRLLVAGGNTAAGVSVIVGIAVCADGGATFEVHVSSGLAQHNM